MNNTGNLTLEVYQTVHNADFSVEVHTAAHDELNYRLTFRRKANLCKMLEKLDRETVLKAFYIELTRKGNWPERCPVEKVRTKKM